MAKPQAAVIPVERIATRIYLIRGEKVMLDSDLAEMYGVPTNRMNEQVKRNIERFPEDFAFQLTVEEFEALMSQIAISNAGRGGRRKLPRGFSPNTASPCSPVFCAAREPFRSTSRSSAPL
jgi:hypothetical protein